MKFTDILAKFRAREVLFTLKDGTKKKIFVEEIENNDCLLINNLTEYLDGSWFQEYFFIIIRKMHFLSLDNADEIKELETSSIGEKFISISLRLEHSNVREAKIIKKLKKRSNCYEIRLDGNTNHVRIVFFTGPTCVFEVESCVLSYIIDKADFLETESKVDNLINEAFLVRTNLKKNNIKEYVEKVDL